MKRFDIPQVNTPKYWDTHQTATDFGLRQQKYADLAGTGERIVEFGCGLSPFLSQANFENKWGIDFSTETIIKAKWMYPKVNYYCCDVTDTPFHKFFDVSVAGEVIEHLDRPEDLIKEMARVTKNRIIISTPQLEFEDPEHLWEFTEEDLILLLSPYGNVRTETVESERFKGRKYLFACAELSLQE